MDIELFNYELPEELIAQTPAQVRDECRLLCINKKTQKYEDKIFKDIIDYLKPGDVIVRNNTKVLPARIFGTKEGTGAHVEILLLKQLEGDIWECLAGNAKPIKVERKTFLLFIKYLLLYLPTILGELATISRRYY